MVTIASVNISQYEFGKIKKKKGEGFEVAYSLGDWDSVIRTLAFHVSCNHLRQPLAVITLLKAVL